MVLSKLVMLTHEIEHKSITSEQIRKRAVFSGNLMLFGRENSVRANKYLCSVGMRARDREGSTVARFSFLLLALLLNELF